MAKIRGLLEKMLRRASGIANETRASKTPPSPLRRTLQFETLESRLLLSDSPLPAPAFTDTLNFDANLNLATVAGMNAKLEVVDLGGATPVLRLWDNNSASTLASVTLDENVQVNLTGSMFSDSLTLDLGYDDLDDSYVAWSIKVVFGGDNLPLVSDDTFVVQHDGPDRYDPFSLFIDSTPNVVFNDGVTVQDALDVQSDELIDVNAGAALVADHMYLGVTKQITDGFDLLNGLNILGDATGAITVNGGSLSALDIGLVVNTSVNINTQDAAYLNNVLKIAFVQATSDASILVDGAASLNATGELILRANSTLNTTALTQPNNTSNQSDQDASVASNIVSSSARIRVEDSASLNVAAGDATLSALNVINVTSDADGTAGPQGGAAVGGTVAVSEVSGDTLVELLDSSSVSAGNLNVLAGTSRTVQTKARATVGGATNPGGNNTQGQQQLANNNAQTGQGSVGFAAAVAVTHVEEIGRAHV